MDEIQTEDQDVKIPHITRQQLQKDLEKEYADRRLRIETDFSTGFDFINKYSNSATVFGSARFTEDHPYYQKAREVGAMLANEGYTVVTGGAGGIMEAANRGAYETGGKSLGLNVLLPREQVNNNYVTDTIGFKYFFSRKVFLAFASNALICFPGGFGTMDELFEVLTLIQTKKMPSAPVILFGKDFWRDLDTFIKTQLRDQLQTITPEDTNLYTITDDIGVIRAILKTREYSHITSALSARFFEIT